MLLTLIGDQLCGKEVMLHAATATRPQQYTQLYLPLTDETATLINDRIKPVEEKLVKSTIT